MGKCNCFVPGCKSGSKKAPKVSFFKAPREASRLEKWKKNIPRADKELDESCVVCALHFEDQFIERNFCHTVNGEKVVFPRDRPLLKSDAVPTIFPNLPKYLSKKVPKKREPNRNCNRQCSDDKSTFPTNSEYEGTKTTKQVDNFHPDNCELPSKYWSRQHFRDDPDVTVFSVGDFDETSDSVSPEKMIVVKQCSSQQRTLSIDVFIKGKKCESSECHSLEELNEILSRTDKIPVCTGAGSRTEFSYARLGKNGKIIVCGDRFFSSECDNRVVKGNIRMCLYCKNARRGLLNQRSRLLRRHPEIALEN